MKLSVQHFGLSSAFAVVAGLLLLGPACFIERTEPSTFRAQCSSTSECDSAEACISGLCQLPCTQANAETDCPQEDGFAGCFNGTCASACDSEAEIPCPDPQSCIALDFGESVDLSEFGLGAGFSMCGVYCQEDVEGSCPMGEACLEGYCVDLGGLPGGSGGETGGETGGAP